jgi:SNF2 family DNA or RNA helicase
VRNVWLYNGSLNQAQRKEVLAATVDPVPAGQADVLLVQLQSGGVGLNLQHFDRIIFSGPWWTSALMEQAIGRAVRIGQKEIVQVYHLVLQEEEAVNIDSVMRDKAQEKGSLCRAVLEVACRDI